MNDGTVYALIVLGIFALIVLCFFLDRWDRAAQKHGSLKEAIKTTAEELAANQKKASFERKAEKLANKAIEDAALQARAREILEAKLAEDGEDEK